MQRGCGRYNRWSKSKAGKKGINYVPGIKTKSKIRKTKYADSTDYANLKSDIGKNN